jgi:hypothetical protein
MSGLKKTGRVAMMVGMGLLSSASCKHNDSSMPASPGGSTDGGTSTPSTRSKLIDDTTTGEPIGPLTNMGPQAASTPTNGQGMSPIDPGNAPSLTARATDNGLGGMGGIGGAPGSGGQPGGGVGAMGAVGGIGAGPTIGTGR